MELLQSEARGKFQAYIGCPMWGNKAWIGKLYPPATKAGDFLQQYARSFNGIESDSDGGDRRAMAGNGI